MYQKCILYFCISLLFFIGISCQPPGKHRIDYNRLATFSPDGLQAVIEIPAGTNRKIEFSSDGNDFEVDQVNGKDRVIDFLPYPGNYGFIPATYMDPGKGGDGDALDILVISESLPTGTVQEVKVIGALEIRDGGELDTKIIAVPIAVEEQIITAENFQDFLIQYDAAKRIIESWFLHYKGFGKAELIGWQDEAYALREIEKWQLK